MVIVIDGLALQLLTVIANQLLNPVITMIDLCLTSALSVFQLYRGVVITMKFSDCCLKPSKEFFQLYHGEKKLHFDEMIFFAM